MYVSMQDQVCLESQTHACCDGGKLPWGGRRDKQLEIIKTTDPTQTTPSETKVLLAEREKDYGPPDINMTGIGLIWTAQLRNWSGIADFPVIPGTIVALMMTGLKLNRLAKSPDHKDSYDDADGYLEIAKMLNPSK